MFLWTGHFAQRPDTPHDKNKPLKNQSKLTPLASDKFKTVQAIDKELSDAVSFQYPRKNGWFLTVKNDMCFIEPKKRTANFERSSSFFPLLNFWYDGFTVFESSVKAGWYLRMVNNKLRLSRYDSTEEFKKETSFKVTKNIYNNPLQRPMTSQSSYTGGACSICDSVSEVCSSIQHVAPCCKECDCFSKNNNTETSVT